MTNLQPNPSEIKIASEVLFSLRAMRGGLSLDEKPTQIDDFEVWNSVETMDSANISSKRSKPRICHNTLLMFDDDMK